MRSRTYGRNRRVAELVQRLLAVRLQREITEPRFGLVTVSAVDISPDLKNARIFITCLGGEVHMNELIRNLNEKAGHYRHELARVLTMRSVPHLAFVYDESQQRARRLSELIDSLAAPERTPRDDTATG